MYAVQLLPWCLLLSIQVEVWPSGLASIAPEALLVGRQEVKGLNSIIFSKVRTHEALLIFDSTLTA